MHLQVAQKPAKDLLFLSLLLKSQSPFSSTQPPKPLSPIHSFSAPKYHEIPPKDSQKRSPYFFSLSPFRSESSPDISIVSISEPRLLGWELSYMQTDHRDSDIRDQGIISQFGYHSCFQIFP